MPSLADNSTVFTDGFKGNGNSFSIGIRDVAGWMFVIGLLLSIGAWQLHWIANLVTAVLSLTLFVGIFSPLLGYQISKIRHKDEPAAAHTYAKYKK